MSTQTPIAAQKQQQQRLRYSFVKDGQASQWYELPKNQAEQAARKEFGDPHPLWNKLKTEGRIKINIQFMNEEGCWRYSAQGRSFTR